MSALHLNSSNFASEVTGYQGTVIVDFWAEWCGPCQMLMPIMEELASDSSLSVKVAKVNVDQESEIASRYNVTAIPTVIIFKNGQPQKTIVGFHQKQEYVSAVK